MKSNSTRKLGDGYSLALNTGNGTHLTLVYFFKCKRGFEQNSVKAKAAGYFAEHGIQSITLEFGEAHEERSVRVLGEAAKIIEDLREIFKNYDIDKKQIPHIDLRGTNVTSNHVSVVDNWYL